MRKLIIQTQFIVFMVGITLTGFAEPPKDRVTNSLGMEFVLIKPGQFMMGSPFDFFAEVAFSCLATICRFKNNTILKTGIMECEIISQSKKGSGGLGVGFS